jgi:glutamate-5-semialdehyde dehydrogenase
MPGSSLIEMGKMARTAGLQLSRTNTLQKNAALSSLAENLIKEQDQVLSANQMDISDGAQSGLDAAMLDRLTLNTERLQGMAADVLQVADLPDPVGDIFYESDMPNGLHVRKQRVPIGVLGVIYESRPNVTVDVSSLAIKSGNAVILRGGSETLRSNQALVKIIQNALKENHLPSEAVQFIQDADRARVMELLQLNDYVDMLIPRGGASLHTFCRDNSRIPVITGGIGICHLFVDQTANLDASLRLIANAKLQRPTVCNALDTVLVHRSVAEEFLPKLVSSLSKDGVSFRADQSAIPFLAEPEQTELKDEMIMLMPGVHPASEQDFDTEWLSLVLGIKVVNGVDEAIEHISLHSTGHSDGILTQDAANANRFVAEVDSAAVYVNASTRFTDGGQLGLGAEVAISTQRLQARGPMGLNELTTYKWVIQGDYHIRS